MPFRSPAVRQRVDVDFLRGPEYGLDEGEWVSYWAVFPHSLTGTIASAATKAEINPATGRLEATFDAGRAALTRVALAIVDWNLLDEQGIPIPWDPARGTELVDGLPSAAFVALQQLSGNGGQMKPIEAPVDELPNAETVGNGSGGSSSTS